MSYYAAGGALGRADFKPGAAGTVAFALYSNLGRIPLVGGATSKVIDAELMLLKRHSALKRKHIEAAASAARELYDVARAGGSPTRPHLRRRRRRRK